jgi:hypothetical protein
MQYYFDGKSDDIYTNQVEDIMSRGIKLQVLDSLA